ncbi:MAG: plastocyanin/azurin family copper-binding protein [Actinomycetota bacterium]|nr:plastocyanin/azurin family copper-binding protein [Actinomycetota bacterium]
MKTTVWTLKILLLSLVLLAGVACSNNEEGRVSESSKDSEQTDVASESPDTPESPKPSEDESGSDQPAGKKELAKVVDTHFRPAKLVVSAGTTVMWEQTGDQPHSVSASDETFESSPNCSPTASDKCLGEGDVFEFTFDKPGTYEYYCRVHGLPDGTGMAGTVKVE